MNQSSSLNSSMIRGAGQGIQKPLVEAGTSTDQMNNNSISGSICEHACSLKEVPDAPKVQTRILQKIALQSTAFTNFNDLMETLRKEIGPIDMHTKEHIDHIKGILSKVRLNDREWRQYTNFHDGKYTRNLVGHDEKFTALLLCWNKGQASPIHDHAGSSCWVKVLSGTLEETLYEAVDKNDANTGLKETSVGQVAKDGSCYINDSLGYHKVANPSKDEVLVTLHVYSPPFNFCNIFDLQGHVRQACMLAANAPYESFFDVPGSPSQDHVPALTDSSSTDGNCDAVSHPENCSGSLLNFTKRLEDISSREITCDVTLSNEITEAIQSLTLTRQEWDVYTHFSEFRYTRNLLFSNKDFSVILNCWLPGQGTPIHTHGNGTHSWFRVVGGELAMEFFDDKYNSRSNMTFRTDSPPFFEGAGMHLHSLKNSSDKLAVSVHIYNPPYKQLTYVDPTDNNSSKCLPVVHCRGNEQCCDADSGCGSCEAVFTNMNALMTMIDHEFTKDRVSSDRNAEVMALLERCIFNDEEITALSALRRDAGNCLLLHKTHHVSIEINFWDRGFVQPIHDHSNSYSWGKVLRGKISDVTYQKVEDEKEMQVANSALLLQDSLFFHGKNIKHSIRNGPVCEAISVHVTSPPVSQCNYYSSKGAAAPQWFVYAN